MAWRLCPVLSQPGRGARKRLGVRGGSPDVEVAIALEDGPPLSAQMFSTKARVPRDYRANPVAGPGGAEAALAAYGDAPGLELLEMFVGAALLTASPGHCPAPKALQKQQSALSSDSSGCAVKIGRNEGTPIQHIVDIL